MWQNILQGKLFPRVDVAASGIHRIEFASLCTSASSAASTSSRMQGLGGLDVKSKLGCLKTSCSDASYLKPCWSFFVMM